MKYLPLNHNDDTFLEKLKAVRNFSGDPKDFWAIYLDFMNTLIGSKSCFLLKKKGATDWSVIFSVPDSSSLNEIPRASDRLRLIASQALKDSFVVEDNQSKTYFMAGSVVLSSNAPDTAIVFLLDSNETHDQKELSEKYFMNSDIPMAYQNSFSHSKQGIVQVIDTLDIMSLINSSDHFVHASMTLCNEIATKYQCSRVSLGWVEGGYIEINAISHMEKFDKKTEVLKLLSQVMEESLDQNVEINFPAKPGSSELISINHKLFASQQQVDALLSVPLRLDGQVVAVLSCERAVEFSEQEIKGLRVLCDQAARRLSDLKSSSLWFGLRLFNGVKKFFASFLGVRHTGMKLLLLILCIATLLLALVPYEYRVEASFSLKTESMMFMPAPFDGYVKTVYVKTGDKVQEGSPILDLDTEELLIQKSILIADISRYTREQRKFLISNELSDMKIAASLRKQSEEKLKEILFYIDSSTLVAKKSGVVVEGELDKMIGAPVKKGDVLYKMASLDNLYLELEINEEYINEVKEGTKGGIVFITEPKDQYPITVNRVVPVSIVKDEANKFVAKGELDEKPMDWWRPGMTGVAKLDAGSHSLLWIMFRKTIDFIYLKLWW